MVVSAIQKGTPNAFAPYLRHRRGLENVYVDGISLTYQSPPRKGRKHIWTFASGFAIGNTQNKLCPCVRGGPTSTQIPGFVGHHYFCESGTESIPQNQTYYVSNPLWDGRGCSRGSNNCCKFNSPPWFVANLSEATSSNLEMRILLNEQAKNENIIVTEVEIFVK